MPHNTPQTIRFVIIRNPLVPDVKHIEERVLSPGKPLSEYIGELSGVYAFSVNGRVVPQSDLCLEVPQAGDVIAIAPVPMGGGGGGGKSIVRLVAVVALTYFTMGTGAYTLGGLTGLTAGSAGMVAASAAVMIGGTMMINALLPYSKMNARGSRDSGSDSRTYGVDGAKNTSEEGLPIPVVYGRHRQAGNIIGNYTTLSGQTQYLHLLINAGEGVTAGVAPGSIQLNDQPIDSLTDVEYRFFHGNDGQETTGVFDRQITPNQVTINREMKKSNVWTEFTTSVNKEVEGVRLDFLASLYRMDDNGNEQPHSVDVIAEIKPFGAPDTEFRPLTTGVSRAHSARGWQIDMAGARLINGEIKEVKKGSQFIDKTRPNIFDKASGLYRNYYVKSGTKFVLVGEAVTPNGAKNTTYYGRPYGHSRPENTVAPRELPSASGLTEYDYGELVSNGKVVGTYHKFHAANIMVSGYNADSVTTYTQNDATLRLTGRDASATMRFSFESPRLPEGRYVVRARRTTDDSTDEKIGDTVVLNEVSEIVYSDIAYNHTALLYVKVKISDQISSIPKVTFENLGRVIRVWDEAQRKWVASADSGYFKFPISSKEAADFPPLTAEQHKETLKRLGTITPNVRALSMPVHMLPKASAGKYVGGVYDHDNPAWIAWDMFTDTRFGGGIDPSRLDFWAFKKWADYCRAKGLHFRAVIDGKETLWDALASVFRVGRAVPVRTGTRYTVSIEMPKEKVMSFGVDNIVEGSFSINWMGVNDRANEIELTYYDEEYDYKQRVIKVYDKQAAARGAKPVSTSTKLVGVVTNEQAVREANFMLNTNKLVETVTFTAPVEALACTIGSVIEVQHNMMTWGEAGKLAGVSKVAAGVYDLVLDHEISFEKGKAWKINLQTSVVDRGTFKVESVLGGYVILTGFDPNKVGRVSRAKVANVETPVFDTFVDSNGKKGIVVRDFDAFATGASVRLFDTDVIVSAAVTPPVYGSPVDRVRVSGLTVEPQKFDHFMVGFPEFQARLFTVRSIGLTGDDMTRQITALEYDERVFDDSDTDFIVTDNAYERALTAVENVEITESAVFDGAGMSVRATITWTHPSTNYKNAEVSVTVNNGQIQRLGRQTTHASVLVKPGDRIDVTIIPYAISGKAGAVLKTGVVLTGIPQNSNDMPVTGGAVAATNGGLVLSGLQFDPYRVKQVEIWAIRQGTVIGAGYGQGIVGDKTKIEDLKDPTVVTAEGIELFGKQIGYADQFGRFSHIITDRNDEKIRFFYWARTIDMVDAKGPMGFVGSGRAIRSAAFNDVSVYTYAVKAPARPTGGSYDSPRPVESIWKQTPDRTGVTNKDAALFISSRRFCSVDELSDPSWSMPAAIYDPKEAEAVEPSIKPTGVNVTAAFGAIRVSWDKPVYEGHGKTQVFVQRVLVNASGTPLSAAKLDMKTMLAAEETSTMVSIAAAAGYGYYVWVRHINKAGIEGPVHTDGGAFVLVRLTPEEMSNLLDKQIKFDFLDTDVADTLKKAGEDAKKAFDSLTTIDKKASESLALSQTTAEVGLRLLMQQETNETERRIEWYGPDGVRGMVDKLRENVLGKGGAIEKVEQMIGVVQGGAASGLKELSESVASLDSSMANKISEIYAKFRDVDVSSMANINEVKTSIADAKKAISDLTTTVAANKKTASDQLTSEINACKQAITDESGARAADINGVKASLDTVGQKIAAETLERSNAITTLNKSMATLETKLSATISTLDKAVSTEIAERKASVADVNKALSETESRLSGAVSGVDGKVETEITERKSAVTALNTSITEMNSRLTGSLNTLTGKINTEISERKAATTAIDKAVAEQSSALQANIDGVDAKVATEVADRKTAVSTVASSVTALDTKLSGSISSVDKKVATEIADRKAAVTGVNESIAALDTKLSGSITGVDKKVTTEIADRKTAITSVNESIAAIDTKLSGAVDGVSGKLNAEIAERKAADVTLTNSVTAVETRLSGSIDSLDKKVATEISDRKSAITSVNSALTSLESSLKSLISTEAGKIATEISDRKAAIATEQKARADLQTSLTSSINGVSASVSTLSSTVAGIDGKYNSQWGVKTKVGDLQGGIGFFNDGKETSFLIEADALALISRNAAGTVLRTSPFKVVNGKAFLSDAYIDNAVIENIVAKKITADYINALSVVASSIVAGASLSAPVISGGRISIGSRFSVDEGGNMVANNANINGIFNASTFRGGNIEGAVIRGGAIRGTNIQASRFVVDAGLQVLSWANQETYGTMDLPTIVGVHGQNAPFVCNLDGVVADVSSKVSLGWDQFYRGGTYRANLSYPIVSYNHSDRSRAFRYSRKLISPKVTVRVWADGSQRAIDANMALTFIMYAGGTAIWSWQAPAVSQDGSDGQRPGGGISWAMPNGTCTCSFSSYDPPNPNHYSWVPGSFGFYEFVLQFNDLPYWSDGTLDVGITVRALHDGFNDGTNELTFRIEDTANNATQPNGPGPG